MRFIWSLYKEGITKISIYINQTHSVIYKHLFLLNKHFSFSFLFKILFIARYFSQCTQPTRPLWRPHSVDVVMLHVSLTFCWWFVFWEVLWECSRCTPPLLQFHCEALLFSSIMCPLSAEHTHLNKAYTGHWQLQLSNCFHLVAPSSEMRQNRKQFHVLHRSSGLIFIDCIAQWWSQSYIINNR